MASKVKSYVAPAALGGTLGIGAQYLGDKAKKDYDDQFNQYNTARPDLTSSKWVAAGQDELALRQKQAQQDMQAQSASQLASARSQLASRGGLRQGSAERLAQNIATQNLAGAQGLERDSALQQADLKTKGAQFDQEQLINEWVGNQQARAGLEASRGKGGRGGAVGGLGKVTGK